MAERVSAYANLFQRLRPFIRTDLTVSNGIPNPVAGSILNWFDPANPEYLARVDAWQRLLCTGATSRPIPFLSEDYERVGIYRDQMDARFVRATQQVAKLVYKFHGEPAKKTDWDEVEDRLSHPHPLRLKDIELEGIRRILSGIQPIDLNTAKGRFGPGATSEGFNAYQKWSRIGQCPDVPPSLFRANPRDDFVPTAQNLFRITKMAEVPKSIKSNRVVSSEPAMSMFAQLAINDELVAQLHTLFVGHVSLDNQEKHNKLLRLRGMATLDLSDASDHNSCDLVKSVLPQLWPVLAKVRSEWSITPRSLFRLGTFAPMGSGLCFSIMTLVILGIIAYAFSSLGFRWRSEQWSVYGDDIIVPVFIADYVIDLLERAGFVVNGQKSCTSCEYLESCGLELYQGIDVTPAYIKDAPESLSASKVEQFVAHCYESFPATATEVARLAAPVRGSRYNTNLQSLDLLVRVKAARSKISVLDGYPGLNRWFCIGTQEEYRLEPDGDVRKTPSGVRHEVWTKDAWRYRSSINYPYLTLLFATGALPKSRG
jgi:hypothetical protein